MKKTEVTPESIEQEDLYELIKKFKELNSEIKQLAEDESKLKEDLRIIARDTYLEMYSEDGINPESLVVIAYNDEGKRAEYLFSPSDRYLSIKDIESYQTLKGKYGESFLDKQTTTTINPVIVKKYEKEIINYIKSADFIEEHEVKDIVIQKDTFSVKKGTFNKLSELENISEAYIDLGVIDSIKSPKISK